MILLKKGGKVFHKKEYDKKNEGIYTSLIPYLCEKIEFEDGVTFEDFMIHIFSHSDEYNDVFSSHLGHYQLCDWIPDFLNAQDIDKPEIIEYLEIMHSDIEINATGIMNSYGIDDLSTYNSFHGIGAWDEKETGESMGGIAIEYTSLYKLRKLPLKLNTKVRIRDIETYNEVCIMETCFTVYDVIGAILYEISWSGNPKKRDEQCKMIFDDAKKIRKEIDDGTIQTKSGDEVFDELKKKFEKRIKKC